MQVVVLLLLLCLVSLLKADPTQTPRVIFKDTFKRLSLDSLNVNYTDIQLLLGQQDDVITAAGENHLYFANLHNLLLSPKTLAFGSECSGSRAPDCQYNITVIHKRKDDNQLFMCGNNGAETTCCNMIDCIQGFYRCMASFYNQDPRRKTTSDCYAIIAHNTILYGENEWDVYFRNLTVELYRDEYNMSEPSVCTPSEQFASIKQVHIKEGEPSVLIESSGGEELYVTHSGTEKPAGIYRSGMNKVGPDNHRKEQEYVSLVVSKRTTDQQNKIFAFYNEKKTDPSMDSDMWLPFVSQVCMADHGGSKGYRQFEWTSQLQARLYCGDKSSRKHYRELVDVAALHSDQWQDTRVYALFKNEWGTSAVCVYTVGDIERVFTTSRFKGFTGDIPNPRPGACTGDRAKMAAMIVVENHSEMEDTVQPHRAFVSPHHYTHLCVDSIHNQTVLLLSLENGGVQKVLENDTKTFIIAEYRPFSHGAHIVNMIINPSTKKLYVSSRREIVQINLKSCAQYGPSCDDCVLARDPYCGWDGTRCSPATSDTLQNMKEENHDVCSHSKALTSPVEHIMVPWGSKHFLQCPILSHHAEYSWHHVGSKTTSCDPTEDHCLLLIDSMSDRDQGLYRCECTEKDHAEKDHNKTLAQYSLELEGKYSLQLESRATALPVSVTLTLFCLIVAAVMLC